MALKDFSEKQFFSALEEKIEDRRGYVPGTQIEISLVDISIEKEKGAAFILVNLICNIVVEGDQEDKIKLEIKIFSKNNIKIYAS